MGTFVLYTTIEYNRMSDFCLLCPIEIEAELTETLISHELKESHRAPHLAEIHYFYVDKFNKVFGVENFRKQGVPLIDCRLDEWRAMLVKNIYATDYKLEKYMGYLPPSVHKRAQAYLQQFPMGKSGLVLIGVSEYLTSKGY